jgi:hypothetical protein
MKRSNETKRKLDDPNRYGLATRTYSIVTLVGIVAFVCGMGFYQAKKWGRGWSE